LEDKLISIKNLVLKHASSSDFTSFIEEMRDEMENLPGDMQPSKIMHDEKRLDRVLKENRNLVMRSKELEIKLDARDGHCARLQEKVTKDANHIHSLATIIDKLRIDIGSLQSTIDTVKSTQERVRDEYEDTLMKQRALFDEEIVALSEGMREEARVAHHKGEDEKKRLENQIRALKEKLEATEGSNCWSACSSLASLTGTLSPPATPLMRPESSATERSVSSISSARTIVASLGKIVNHKGEVDITELKEELQGDDFDFSDELESSLELFNGMLRSKDDEITHLKVEANELHRELELLRVKENNFKDMEAVASDEAEAICKYIHST